MAQVLLALTLFTGAAAFIVIAAIVSTAIVCAAMAAVPCVIIGLVGRALWHRTPEGVREYTSRGDRMRGGRDNTRGELPSDWWEQFEREFRAYSARNARRRHRRDRPNLG